MEKACTEPTVSATRTPTTSDPELAAATEKVCAEAVPLSEKSSATFEDAVKALTAAFIAGGEEFDPEGHEKKVRANFNNWSTKLTALAEEPIEEPVKAVLTETATYVKKVNDPNDLTPTSEVIRQLKALTEKVKTACA